MEQKSARFVVSLCQDVIAATFHTLYQLYAISPEERSSRDRQAQKLVATWGTYEMWLQLFPSDENSLSKLGTGTIDLPPRIQKCVEGVAKLKDVETCNMPERLSSFPDVLT